jgi:DNA-binding NarL/FixJ family response regulator
MQQRADRDAAGERHRLPGWLRADQLASLGLTEREHDVVALLAHGHSDAGIAGALFITPKTASSMRLLPPITLASRR